MALELNLTALELQGRIYILDAMRGTKLDEKNLVVVPRNSQGNIVGSEEVINPQNWSASFASFVQTQTNTTQITIQVDVGATVSEIIVGYETGTSPLTYNIMYRFELNEPEEFPNGGELKIEEMEFSIKKATGSPLVLTSKALEEISKAMVALETEGVAFGSSAGFEDYFAWAPFSASQVPPTGAVGVSLAKGSLGFVDFDFTGTGANTKLISTFPFSHADKSTIDDNTEDVDCALLMYIVETQGGPINEGFPWLFIETDTSYAFPSGGEFKINEIKFSIGVI